MAGRRRSVLDIREMLRRFRLGETDRRVARDLRASRRTVKRYRAWAASEGLLKGDLPEPGALDDKLRALEGRGKETGPASTVEPYREVVVELRRRGVEVAELWRRLVDERGYSGSYGAVHRFVRRLEPKRPEVTVRVEVPPGEEAQVDFGYAGRIPDEEGHPRKAWVFVMTLSFSRHQYAEIVFDQTVETWLGLHVRAFEAIGGVPRRVVLDNLKAGIVKASVYDPVVQRAYRDLAEHYGFIISPCRPRTPEHKGKTERGVKFLKRSYLAGREFPGLRVANEGLARWVQETAGTRIHGTTRERPLERFEEVERAAFLPLPAVRYELSTWKKVKHHRDCHVVFEKSYYSAPHRFVGEELWVRGTAKRVEIFREHELVATHSRAKKPGERLTKREHLPPQLVAGLELEPEALQEEAARIGPATLELVSRLLAERPLDRRRAARAVLQLERRYGVVRLEGACRRATLCEETSYRAVKRILQRDLDLAPLPPEVLDPVGTVPREAKYSRVQFVGLGA